MYLLTLSDASLYIRFLRYLENFPRDSEGYVLFAVRGGRGGGVQALA